MTTLRGRQARKQDDPASPRFTVAAAKLRRVGARRDQRIRSRECAEPGPAFAEEQGVDGVELASATFEFLMTGHNPSPSPAE